jgi:phenylalanyl-tRNA synthetase beta chain
MQFPESWLREFCNPPISTAELADLLTMSGLEVEELRPVAPPFRGVVVGEVRTVNRHPNADRLNVCTVDAGTGTVLQIVCGAPNVRPGIRVPCALVGAELPPAEEGAEPFVIRLGQLRGVESQGMLCSASELRLSDDAAGLHILADDAPIGRNLREVLALDDTLFTLKLTPNLGHLLSVYGVAREVSALTGAPLRTPSFAAVAPSTDQILPARVAATDLCGRFSGRVVRGVDTKARTPAWMVERLARCGQRSVTALVDISNYVMFEFGRPSHIFDLDKIHGGLEVRWGRAGERLKLLNGNTIEVDAAVGVIADDEAVESLAGIMGGDATAVSDDTRHVYVEAAFWWPEAVSGRSRRYAFSTDAGHRFERGVDPATTVEHIEHITRLIVDICGTPETRVGPIDDQQPAMPQRTPVTLRVARASRIIGMPVTAADCAAVFRRLGLPFTEAEGTLTVTPPSWRFDIAIEEDLIEEVARVIGFHRLPTTPPRAALQARIQPEQRRPAHEVRHRMAGLGYVETINYSFVEARTETELAGNADPIQVLNPIASQLAVMRSSLIGSLIGVLRNNLARKASRVRVFEVGRVFRREAGVADGAVSVAGIDQPVQVAGLAFGPADEAQWGVRERAIDFFDVKGDVEQLLAPLPVRFEAASHPALHPGRSARVIVGGQAAGFVGELHPKWRQGYDLPSAPVVFELSLQAISALPLPVLVPVPRQQSAWRDLALIVKDSVTLDALLAAVHAAGAEHLRSTSLFDVFKPTQLTGSMAADERSLAIRLELRDDRETLTDARIDSEVAKVVQAVSQAVGARLRA